MTRTHTRHAAHRPAVFFDRDGIVNRRLRGDYVTSASALEILPDVAGSLRALHDAGFLLILVTNQRGIALGRMTTAKVRAIHREMQRAIVERHGTPFDAIYVCPHDTAAGCECRKPKPGMLTRAAREKRIDLKESWMIGDMESDVIAGRAAGCQTILVTDDKHATRADMVVGSLPEGVHAILSYSHAVRRRVGDA